MPNDTLRANAQAMPIDRRAALSSIAAAGALLVAPRTAKAAGDEAEIFDRVERVRSAHSRLLAVAAVDYANEDESERAFAVALDALSAQQASLLSLRPQTIRTLQAMAETLLATDAFGLDAVAGQLARMIVDVPDAT